MCTTLCNHQGRSAGTRDQGLGWGGAGEPGGCSCHPREGLTPPPTPCWSHQVTAAAVQGSRERRRCTCLQHTSLSSTSVVIKGRALVKYGTQGARLLHAMQEPLGVIRGQGPSQGPQRKSLFTSCGQNPSLFLSSFSLTFLILLFPPVASNVVPIRWPVGRDGFAFI